MKLKNYNKNNIKNQFIGLKTQYPTVDGVVCQRTYLDTSATSLMLKPALDVVTAFLKHNANTHSSVHYSATIASQSLSWSRSIIADFLGISQDDYSVIFIGNGSTAAINRAVKIFSQIYLPEKNIALVSKMEHHSNDLPHRSHMDKILHFDCKLYEDQIGAVSLEDLDRKLHKEKNKVAYVGVTAASNVTGVINPICDIAEITDRYGVSLLVDATQYLVHSPVDKELNSLANSKIDAFVFSGHKAYAPMSPGVLVIKKSLLKKSTPEEFGGGIVKEVFLTSHKYVEDCTEREHAGTINVPGSVLLASSLIFLKKIGMQYIFETEKQLISYTISKISHVKNSIIYADNDTKRTPRVGAVAFNIKGIPHGLVAAILNDYFNITVRNDCFCAHPYVRELLLPELMDIDLTGIDEADEIEYVKQFSGMVRISFGIYSSFEDIDKLYEALNKIAENYTFYKECYKYIGDGTFMHNTHKIQTKSLFDPEKIINELYDKNMT